MTSPRTFFLGSLLLCLLAAHSVQAAWISEISITPRLYDSHELPAYLEITDLQGTAPTHLVLYNASDNSFNGGVIHAIDLPPTTHDIHLIAQQDPWPLALAIEQDAAYSVDGQLTFGNALGLLLVRGASAPLVSQGQNIHTALAELHDLQILDAVTLSIDAPARALIDEPVLDMSLGNVAVRPMNIDRTPHKGFLIGNPDEQGVLEAQMTYLVTPGKVNEAIAHLPEPGSAALLLTLGALTLHRRPRR